MLIAVDSGRRSAVPVARNLVVPPIPNSPACTVDRESAGARVLVVYAGRTVPRLKGWTSFAGVQLPEAQHSILPLSS